MRILNSLSAIFAESKQRQSSMCLRILSRPFDRAVLTEWPMTGTRAICWLYRGCSDVECDGQSGRRLAADLWSSTAGYVKSLVWSVRKCRPRRSHMPIAQYRIIPERQRPFNLDAGFQAQ